MNEPDFLRIAARLAHAHLDDNLPTVLPGAVYMIGFDALIASSISVCATSAVEAGEGDGRSAAAVLEETLLQGPCDGDDPLFATYYADFGHAVRGALNVIGAGSFSFAPTLSGDFTAVCAYVNAASEFLLHQLQQEARSCHKDIHDVIHEYMG